MYRLRDGSINNLDLSNEGVDILCLISDRTELINEIVHGVVHLTRVNDSIMVVINVFESNISKLFAFQGQFLMLLLCPFFHE